MSGEAPRTPGRPIRVCFVGPSLDILGGQAVQLDRLRRQFRDDPDVTVDFIPVNPRLPGPLRALQRVKYVRTVVTGIAYAGTLLRRVGRYDVVHAFSASYWSYLLAPLPAMLVARLYARAVVLNYRSGEAPDHLARWTRSRRTMRLAHLIVVPSGYLVEEFGRFGLGAESIPNFVDVARMPYRERPTPRPVFLSNRNLEPLYNVGCVLRAFARVQARVPDARLIVVGDGSQRGALEELARELGLQQVEFRGRVAPEAMAAVYAEADVYLNSPDIDNMPGSIIEAFAAGLPVVSTNAGGIPFIVDSGRTGLLVERNDHVAMADAALRVLLEAGLAGALAGAARQECVSRYTWPQVRAHWVDLYRSACARAGRALVRP